jgi:ribosomal-protein-alanine N-acetyltransferase
MCAEEVDLVYALERGGQKDPWSRQAFVGELDNPVASVDVYWHDDEPVGYLCSWLIAGELQIQNLVVAPSVRRQGVAVRLLRHLFVRSVKVGLETAFLEVRTSNEAAIALYRRFGFIDRSIRRVYYPDGEDALIMAWWART